MATIGEAARRSGVHIETIRYYERAGVVPRPARSEAGRRQYDEAGIARLRFMRRCRALGFSITDARHLAGLTGNPDAACPDARRVAETHLSGVRARIAALRDIESQLETLVDGCTEHERSCPVLDKLQNAPDADA